MWTSRRARVTARESLSALGRAYEGWVAPFIEAWITTGGTPLVGTRHQEQIAAKHNARPVEAGTLPTGYHWLPELLKRLTGSIRFNGRNFVNIHPTPHVPSLLASLVVAMQNPNNIVSEVSAATTQLEKESVVWMAENLLSFDPKEAWGNVVSGGTIANLTALLVARDYTYRKLSRPRPMNVRARGLHGAPAGVVLATAGCHYSVKKALWLLGMGEENVISIPVAYDEAVARQVERDKTFVAGVRDATWSKLLESDGKGDRHDELEKFYAGEHAPFELQPLSSQTYKALYSCFTYGTPLIAYVFTAGTTDTGTIEKPTSDVLDRLLEEDIYVHVDAAAGGFALLHDRIRKRAEGLERAHSATIDGHKVGHLAYPNGAIIFRKRGWMYEIMHEAPYLKDLAPTIEGSRPGTHVAALWAAIEDLRKTGAYQVWLGHVLDFVEQLEAEVKASGQLQLLHKVDLTTLAVAPLPKANEDRRRLNKLVERAHDAITRDESDEAFLVNIDRGLSQIKVKNSNRGKPGENLRDGDTLEDIYCFRIVAANPAVSLDDASRLVEYLERKLHDARIELGR